MDEDTIYIYIYILGRHRLVWEMTFRFLRPFSEHQMIFCFLHHPFIFIFYNNVTMYVLYGYIKR